MNWHDLEVRVCLVRVEIEWIENNEKNGFVCCLVKKKGKKTFWVEPRYFSTGPTQNLSLHIREKTSMKNLLEYPHQWMQTSRLFYTKKATFSILHTHFYKPHTSVYLFYTFIQ